MNKVKIAKEILKIAKELLAAPSTKALIDKFEKAIWKTHDEDIKKYPDNKEYQQEVKDTTKELEEALKLVKEGRWEKAWKNISYHTSMKRDRIPNDVFEEIKSKAHEK